MKKIKGIQGLPISSSGRGLLLLSGGIDSPVAAFEMMKRGLSIDAIHFASPPYTSDDSLQKVKDLIKKLAIFDPTIKLIVIDIAKFQVTQFETCDKRYSITLLRRMMMRVATKIAEQRKIKVLITGESLGQVASQTVESLSVINEVTVMPILRPLIAADKETIILTAKKIDTYDISIRPFDDCCTLFMPKNPVINPLLEVCQAEELKLDINDSIDTIVNSVKIYEVADLKISKITAYQSL